MFWILGLYLSLGAKSITGSVLIEPQSLAYYCAYVQTQKEIIARGDS